MSFWYIQHAWPHFPPVTCFFSFNPKHGLLWQGTPLPNLLRSFFEVFPLCLCFINPWSRVTTFLTSWQSHKLTVLLTFKSSSEVTTKGKAFSSYSTCLSWHCGTLDSLFWNPISSIWLQGDCLAVVLFLVWHGMKRKWPKFILGWLADASASTPFIMDWVKARSPLLYVTRRTVHLWTAEDGKFIVKAGSFILL